MQENGTENDHNLYTPILREKNSGSKIDGVTDRRTAVQLPSNSTGRVRSFPNPMSEALGDFENKSQQKRESMFADIPVEKV